MKIEIVKGDILKQDVDVIVNSWNRNIIPWWLLLPQGVSAAIKKVVGSQPFRDLAKFGAIELGGARETSAGGLAYKSLIHVAGINLCWFATSNSVRQSVFNAMAIVNANPSYESVAFPLIGSGSGNRGKDWSLQIMKKAFAEIDSEAKVIVVIFENK